MRADIQKQHFSNPDRSNQNQKKTDIWQIWERIWWSKWLIIFTTCLFGLGGLLYAVVTEPVYSADALLQIEQLKDSTSGEELGDELSVQGSDSPFIAELQILRSRTILGNVIDQYQLDIEAKPKHFPVIGQALARWRYSNTSSSNSDISTNNKGGPVIQVDSFDIPRYYFDKPFVLTTLPNDQYELADSDENVVLVGTVGEKSVAPEFRDQEFSLGVSLLQSEVDSQFVLSRNNRVATVETLRDALRITELGPESGIVKLELLGTDPSKIVNILDSIVEAYLQKKSDAKIAVAQKNLDFLETRLPEVKNNLERFESELNAFRLERGSIDFNLETQSTLSRIVTIEADIGALNLKRKELRTRFTAQHPNVTGLDAQKNLLAIELQELENAVNTLPQVQQQYLALTRNVDVNTTLYTALLSRAQELKIAMASATNDISVLDFATVGNKPVKPKKAASLIISLLIGAAIGVLLSLFKDSLVTGVEDPAELEEQLSIPVLATIPQSAKQIALEKHAMKSKARVKALAYMFPNDKAIESLRSLRSTLLFQESRSTNNVLLITSASPKVGKTFTSLNMAIVLANSGRSVVLVDGDMRRGYLHKSLRTKQSPGLSDAIKYSLLMEDCVRSTPIKGLSFIARGLPPEKPSDLLFTKQFLAFMQILSHRFDHVIVDAPPVLAAADAGIMGNSAGNTLLVVKSGVNPIREIAQCKKQLAQNSVELTGIILNSIKMTKRSKSYGGYVYQYTTENS